MGTAPTSATDEGRPAATVAVAVLAFFVVTLDAVVVNVALPSIRSDLGGGVRGLQWVVAGYTLVFAALLLSAGSLSDRVGARRAIAVGLGVFVLSSVACGVAPTLAVLVVSRLCQGAAAAAMMPASLALVRQAHDDPGRRARAVAAWAMGGAAASSAGPVVGGVLTMVDWRWVFLINVPVGVVGAVLLRRVGPSPRRPRPFDLAGQVSAFLTMGSLTFGVIESGELGLLDPVVIGALTVAVLAASGFVVSQRRGAHPMVPPSLFASPGVGLVLVVGFAFTVGFYGMPFLLTLYFQEARGLTSLDTGLAFVPMMVVGLVLTPWTAVMIERVGPRVPIVSGLALMAAGMFALGWMPVGSPTWVPAALMVLVGIGGPLVMPPAVGVMLSSVPVGLAGTSSGALNTSRQAGGALAVAVFGSLASGPLGFAHGLRLSLVLGGVVLLAASCLSVRLRGA